MSVVVLGWVLLVPGLDAVRQAVTANSVDQAYYIGTAERLSRATANYLDTIWGTENSAWVLDHLTSLPEPPSVILLDRGSVQNGGGWSTVRSEDLLGAWIADNYAPPIADGTFFVVVPSAPDPLPAGVNPDRPGC